MKKIIKKMQNGVGLSYSGIYQTYRLSGKSLNKTSVDRIIYEGLVKRGEEVGYKGYRLELTEKGKNLNTD